MGGSKFDSKNPHLGGNVVGGDPFSLCPNMWLWAIEKFGIRSVLDIGCGEGNALEYFKGQNIRVLGMDGLKENVDEVQKRGINCDLFDLTKGHYTTDHKFDMAWCCELVEHVEARFVDNILDTFLNCGMIFMTHGLPRQRGYHHVNCQTDEYWIALMGKKGFEYLKEESVYSRSLAKGMHWGKSGLIFRNLNWRKNEN